jgi:hypothetical protein
MPKIQDNWTIGERNANDNTLTLRDGAHRKARTIAYVTPQPFYDKEHTQEYYARLIVSTPNLLDTLETILARVDNTNINTPIKDMQDTWKIGRDAIAKALGE